MGAATQRGLRAALGCLALGLAAGCGSVAPAPVEPGVDIVSRNGAVYTVNDEQPWAEAVAVNDGKIVFVGLDEDAEPYISYDTEVVDIGDGLLLPGFHDSHMHPMRAGNRFLRCQMKGLAWPESA